MNPRGPSHPTTDDEQMVEATPPSSMPSVDHGASLDGVTLMRVGDDPAVVEPTPLTPRVAAVQGLRALPGALWRMARGLASAAWRARLWLALSVGYIALGLTLATRNELIILDELSRSAHAYLVWANGPPKLAALGFVWGPLLTLPMVAVSWIPGVGRSGLSALAISAPVMAGALVVIYRYAKSTGAGLWSYVVLGLLIANPILAFYGSNGMGEAWAILLPSIALIGTLEWHATRSTSWLSIASFAAAAGVMARYELIVIPLLVFGIVIAATIIEEHDVAKARALAVFAALPTIYVIAVWMYFNWVVQGSPIWFLTSGGQIATAAGTASTVGTTTRHVGALAGAWQVIDVQIRLSPLVVPVTIALAALAARRRSWFPIAVAVFVNYSLIAHATIVATSGNNWLANTRFNMRTIPLAVIALIWIAREVRGRRWLSHATLAAGTALMAVGIIATVGVMQHARPQFYDAAFLKALTTSEPVSNHSYGGELLSPCTGARDMGRYIERNVHGYNSIVADDSSAFAVITFSGHPERFIDSLDKGSAYLGDQLSRPTRSSKYLLVSNFTDCAGISGDMVTKSFGPSVYASGAPGLTLVHETHGFRLMRITRSKLAR